jgi:CheY-like chemotaxis protein
VRHDRIAWPYCSYAGNGKDALDARGAGGVDVVVTDVQLPGGISGLEIADRAKAAGVGCVLITGYGEIMSELARQKPRQKHCMSPRIELLMRIRANNADQSEAAR